MTIEITSLRTGYEHFLLKDVSLSIPTGSFSAFIGPNGSGKSTLLKSIARQLAATSGMIQIQGKNIAKLRTIEIARLVSILPQHPITPAGITVEQLVAYGRAPHQNFLGLQSDKDKQLVEEALDIVDLNELRLRPLTELSGGQRQRAFLAMCIAQDTPYVLLDEPISYLDVKFQHEVLDLLRLLNQQGRTIIAVLHDIALAARYASHIAVMKDGELIDAGLPDYVLTDQKVETVYEMPAHIYPDPISATPVLTRR